MGGCASLVYAPIFISSSDDHIDISTRQWINVPKLSDAQETFTNEGIINGNSSHDQLEFRTLLDYEISTEYLMNYIKEKSPRHEVILRGWLQIRQYNDSIALSANKNKDESQFYHAYYIFDNSIRNCQFIDMMLKKRINLALDEAQKNEGLTSTSSLVHIFDVVYVKLFTILFADIFVNFSHSKEYFELKLKIKELYNVVRSKDFTYYGMIGKGGFGLVCEVYKRSTGVRYAMKIQSKAGIIEVFGSESWRACLEIRAFAKCKHPFIVELHCAFQTESLLFLGMSLGTWCDLSKLLRFGGPLSVDHARFYSAEIACALKYLHSRRFVYRDLKPGNILLNLDGHVQLVDFGAVSDLDGRILDKCRDHHQISFFADEEIEQGDGVFEETEEPSIKRRAKSLVGTYGYMAPEIVVMLGEENRLNSGFDEARMDKGYTDAVDWWGLGVLVYKMVVGQYPFRCGQDKTAIPTWEILSEPVNYDVPALKGEPEAVDFISSLLVVDDTKRLGSGTTLTDHAFYAEINWTLLEAKQLPVPALPQVKIPHRHDRHMKKYESLTHLLADVDKMGWLEFGASQDDIEMQPHFTSWNYSSPTLIASEVQRSATKSRHRANTSLNTPDVTPSPALSTSGGTGNLSSRASRNRSFSS